jgi:hypothetical protein
MVPYISEPSRGPPVLKSDTNRVYMSHFPYENYGSLYLIDLNLAILNHVMARQSGHAV